MRWLLIASLALCLAACNSEPSDFPDLNGCGISEYILETDVEALPQYWLFWLGARMSNQFYIESIRFDAIDTTSTKVRIALEDAANLPRAQHLVEALIASGPQEYANMFEIEADEAISVSLKQNADPIVPEQWINAEIERMHSFFRPQADVHIRRQRNGRVQLVTQNFQRIPPSYLSHWSHRLTAHLVLGVVEEQEFATVELEPGQALYPLRDRHEPIAYIAQRRPVIDDSEIVEVNITANEEMSEQLIELGLNQEGRDALQRLLTEHSEGTLLVDLGGSALALIELDPSLSTDSLVMRFAAGTPVDSITSMIRRTGERVPLRVVSERHTDPCPAPDSGD